MTCRRGFKGSIRRRHQAHLEASHGLEDRSSQSRQLVAEAVQLNIQAGNALHGHIILQARDIS